MSDSEHLQELVQFLRDKNPPVRQIALSNLLSQTPKGSPHRDLFFAGLQVGGLQKNDNHIIRDIKILCRDQLATAHDAFRALVNLSDNTLLVGTLSELPFMKFLVSYIINPQSILADLASMLLSNLTATASACTVLLSLKVSVLPDPKSLMKVFPVDSRSGTCPAPVPYPPGDPKEVLALPLLIDSFVKAARVQEDEKREEHRFKGNLHFLASVFANLTTVPAGRTFFLTPRSADPLGEDVNVDVEYPLSKVLAFTEHKDVIRRGGVASIIKNCAFQVSAHRALLSEEMERVALPPSTVAAPGVDVLPYVLLPLAGPEEFDLEDQEKLPSALQFLPPTKKRDADPMVRLTHVETLLLFCTTHRGRNHLRQHGVYEIVRALHEHESVEKVSEHVERLVNLIKREEGPESIKDGEGVSSVPVPIANEESDDEDDHRIEEL